MNVICGINPKMMDESDYMLRALELARLGEGSVSPNPMVGCVIVDNGKIIGEGWHSVFGGPHAEVAALSNVMDRSRLRESTLYVTLEPCAHQGKTPPCADLLVTHKLKRVVVATKDPNPKVAGKGVAILRDAGIDVRMGILEEEARFLNRRFISLHENQRPYIVLKWAQTADGFIAKSNYDSKWISSDISRKLVHKWRAEEDAILVGFNTVKHDDPQLGVRNWSGNDPTRLIIDPKLELSRELKVFDGSIPTIVYHSKDVEDGEGFVKLDQEGFIDQLLHDVASRSLLSVLVEGGRKTLLQFIENGFWDEARVFIGETNFEEGIEAPVLKDKHQQETVGSDTLLTYYNKRWRKN